MRSTILTKVPMMLLPTLLFGLATTQSTVEQALDLAQSQLGASVIEALQIDAAQGLKGSQWRLDLDFDGQSYSTWLLPTQVRSPSFRAVANGVQGSSDCTAPSLGTWRGSLDAMPDVQVAVGRGPDGLRIAVLGDPRGDWFVQPASSLVGRKADQPGLHLAYRSTSPFQTGDCGVSDDAISHFVPNSSSATGAGTDCLSLAEIAFDVNYERFLYSSDVVLIQSQVDAYLNAVAAIHIRDLRVDYALTHLEIRTSPGAPYVNDVPGDLLDAMLAEWTTNLAGVQRDLAHLIVGQEMETNVIGPVSYTHLTLPTIYSV